MVWFPMKISLLLKKTNSPPKTKDFFSWIITSILISEVIYNLYIDTLLCAYGVRYGARHGIFSYFGDEQDYL